MVFIVNKGFCIGKQVVHTNLFETLGQVFIMNNSVNPRLNT